MADETVSQAQPEDFRRMVDSLTARTHRLEQALSARIDLLDDLSSKSGQLRAMLSVALAPGGVPFDSMAKDEVEHFVTLAYKFSVDVDEIARQLALGHGDGVRSPPAQPWELPASHVLHQSAAPN